MAKSNKAIVIGSLVGLVAVGVALGGKKKRRGSSAAPVQDPVAFNPNGFLVMEKVEIAKDWGMGPQRIVGYILQGPMVGESMRYSVSVPQQRGVNTPVFDDAGAALASPDQARGHLQSVVDSLPSPYPTPGAPSSAPAPTIEGIALEQVSSGPISGYVMLLARNNEHFAHIPEQPGISGAYTNGPYASKNEALQDLAQALQAMTADASQPQTA